MKSRIHIVIITALAAFACMSSNSVHAEDILFIGNSFTFGAGDPAVKANGGVPKLVEAIAAAKGKTAQTTMLAVGGKDWGFHLQQPKTAEVLAARAWDWVVLQDYSTKPTHIGNVDEFLKNAEAFYKRIREKSPKARILLYATWARPKESDFYAGKSTKTKFVDPAQMTDELGKAYAECQRQLEGLEPGEQVALAPVGAAFARCLQKYPDMVLGAPDKHHASAKGSYLASLVIYATLFNDSPLGAVNEFPGIKIEIDEAKKLQGIADEITQAQRRQP